MPIPIDHSRPTRKSAKESAFNQLQQWIIDGTLHPGEKLNDSELAEALGVSRTPIRESLQLLEAQGFVKMYPGKATQVTEVEKDSLNDLLPTLAALQALSAELAIANITDQTITLLENMNERFSKAIHSENYFSALKVDEEFHQIIVNTANNAYIHNIVTYLQAHVRRLFFHNSIFLTKQSITEHKTVIQLMKKKKINEVSAVMRKNWLRAIDEFRLFKKQ
ncbi:GntR family transcriptional regulator [Virgibacillus alimentarius]|uniref:DNA-binding GntR family transcriptional regulator n=1 Tax=Virgibacillus alimentarius TaxID=698769 RepID=A0ABS4S920_9BACI|nr:GntR family transcriptional regulator [Virgibacillus alimentarius]MBP2257566.1 DNA-binding GntR family transcriptional regulator [Virgibacillus alimentarius]